MMKPLFTRKLCVSRIGKLLAVLLTFCFLLTGALAYGEKRVQYSNFIGDSSPKICAATSHPAKKLKNMQKGRIDPIKDLKSTHRSFTPVSDPFMDGGGTLLSLMFTVNTKPGQAQQTGHRDQQMEMKKIKIKDWETVRAPSCEIHSRS